MTFVQKDLTRLGDTKFQVRPRDKDLSHNSSVVNSFWLDKQIRSSDRIKQISVYFLKVYRPRRMTVNKFSMSSMLQSS